MEVSDNEVGGCVVVAECCFQVLFPSAGGLVSRGQDSNHQLVANTNSDQPRALDEAHWWQLYTVLKSVSKREREARLGGFGSHPGDTATKASDVNGGEK